MLFRSRTTNNPRRYELPIHVRATNNWNRRQTHVCRIGTEVFPRDLGSEQWRRRRESKSKGNVSQNSTWLTRAKTSLELSLPRIASPLFSRSSPRESYHSHTNSAGTDKRSSAYPVSTPNRTGYLPISPSTNQSGLNMFRHTLE